MDSKKCGVFIAVAIGGGVGLVYFFIWLAKQ